MYPWMLLKRSWDGLSISRGHDVSAVGMPIVMKEKAVSRHHLRFIVRILCAAYSSGVFSPEKDVKA